MIILSIETSCDDTCITIMEVKGGIQNATFRILANNSNSQIKTHIPYGGVYPMLAKKEHIKNLPILLEKTLRESGISREGSLGKRDGAGQRKFSAENFRAESGGNSGFPDLIAVTHGPGLEPALWTGITFAQALAKKWKVPVVPVNHMEGHIYSVFGKARGKFSISNFQFPTLALLVSGGHTQLVLIKKFGSYEIIGESLDDAVGEAFDKVARMLGLPYPGGPEISKLAERMRAEEKQFLRGVSQADGPRGSAPRARGDSDPAKIGFSVALPRPMLHSKNFDFSFAGLKTAVLYLIRDLTKKHSNILQNDKIKSSIALEFENAAIECLTYKTQKAIEKYKIKTLIVAGGVAANKHLRNEMRKVVGHAKGRASKKIKLLFPTKELATDNSIMIGIAGYLNYIKNKNLPAGRQGKFPKPESIKANGNLRV